MAKKLCPTCHSVTSEDENTNVSAVKRVRGQEKPGLNQALPENITSITEDVIPLWSDDPVLTREGFNGPEFTNRQNTQFVHWQEIQEARRNEEEEIGLSESQKTDFTDLQGKVVNNRHIIELRESIEKILNVSGSTLEEYFSQDAGGNTVAPGPNDTAKKDWTSVERGKEYLRKDGQLITKFTLPDGTEQDSPSLPDRTRISAIHLEDLRRPIQLDRFREFWSVTPIGVLLSTFDPGANLIFATNFNIAPTDAGSDYDFVDKIKEWRGRRSAIIQGDGSFSKVDVSIIKTIDEDVLELESNSNTLEIVVSQTRGPSPQGNPQFTALTIDVDLKDEFGPVVDRSIRINKDTHFKALTKSSLFETTGVFIFLVSFFLVIEGFGNFRVLVNLIRSAPTTIPASDEVKIIQAPLGGQTFVMRSTGITSANPNFNNITIFPGPKFEQDLSINVDDVIAAHRLYLDSFGFSSSVGPQYVSHKVLDPESDKVVENPNATRVDFGEILFLTSYNDVFQPFDSTVTNVTTLEAIRIENNDKKVRDV